MNCDTLETVLVTALSALFLFSEILPFLKCEGNGIAHFLGVKNISVTNIENATKEEIANSPQETSPHS